MPTINTRFYIQQDKSKILNASIESIKNSLRNMYSYSNIKFYITGITSSDNNRELGRISKSTVEYPYFNIKVTSIKKDTNSYNSFAMSKYGTKPVLLNNDYFYNFHLVPVDVEVTISFVTQDYAQILDYAQQLIFDEKGPTFKIKAKDASVEVTIKVNTSDEVSIPDKDLSSGDPYKIENTLTLKTYVGYLTKIAKLTKVEKIVKFY